MRSRIFRRRRLLLAVVAAVFAMCVPVASASAAAWPAWDPGAVAGIDDAAAGCVGANPRAVNGAPGSIGNAVCGGVTISFIGPSIGQVASAIGPTIIGAPVIVAPITVSNGPVQAVGP